MVPTPRHRFTMRSLIRLGQGSQCAAWAFRSSWARSKNNKRHGNPLRPQLTSGTCHSRGLIFSPQFAARAGLRTTPCRARHSHFSQHSGLATTRGDPKTKLSQCFLVHCTQNSWEAAESGNSVGLNIGVLLKWLVSVRFSSETTQGPSKRDNPSWVGLKS